ncbi:hypothetical protein [Pseudomonas syringae]|uniref:hypothetical protein n=1 Tax=Pseudomonas syringae TaxID=317 RepID=UPI00041FD308|nr:hypothetical protein [Pseudomonas syringae]
MNDFKQHYEFSAPRVPLASPVDGLMPTDSLDKPVIVEIVLWSAMQPGYAIQLKLDGHLVGERKILTSEDRPGNLIYMQLGEENLMEERSYTLCFMATNDLNQASVDTPLIPLIVDRTAPGAMLLAPMLFHQINLGETLTGLIPGYADMQPGDRIQTLCNEQEGPVHEVTPDNLTERPVQIIFDKAFLLDLGSESMTMSYQVIDRAGNRSIMARPVNLSMQS